MLTPKTYLTEGMLYAAGIDYPSLNIGQMYHQSLGNMAQKLLLSFGAKIQKYIFVENVIFRFLVPIKRVGFEFLRLKQEFLPCFQDFDDTFAQY